jgi:hypothetical protein
LFVTLTAPGRSEHRDARGHVCRCTPEGGTDLAEWNATASTRWNRFVQELSRFVGADVVTYDAQGKRHRVQGLSYFRGAEVQRRGALHYHVLLRRRDGAPLAIRTRDFRRIAVSHGFGHSVDVQAMQPDHAAYVAKYVAKSANDRREVPWKAERWARPINPAHKVVRSPVVGPDGQLVTHAVVDTRTGEVLGPAARALVVMPTFRTWASSRTWGDLMRDVRAAQQHWTIVTASLPAWARWDAATGTWIVLRASSAAWGAVDVPVRPDGSRAPVEVPT